MERTRREDFRNVSILAQDLRIGRLHPRKRIRCPRPRVTGVSLRRDERREP